MADDNFHESTHESHGQSRMPIPVYVKDGVYFLEGVGHVDRDGNKIIGLPGDFHNNPFDIARIADDIGALHELDKEIDDDVLDDD